MINLFQYKIPFKQPFRTGRAEYFYREGVLISFEKGEETQLSEASPLPGFSPDSLSDIKKTLSGHKADINAFFTSDFDPSSLRDFLTTFPPFPSLQFAISYLGLHLLLNRNQQVIPGYFNRPGQSRVLVNDVAGITSESKLNHVIISSAENGFATIKLKTGPSPEDLPALLRSTSESFPHITFRLDANQSWPLESLKRYSSLFQGLPIEYIEEPCKTENIRQKKAIVTESGLPVAFDESITSITDLEQVLIHFPETYIVIKPALYGNIFDLAETIYRHRSLGNKVVVSTMLESAVGRWMNAFTAAVIGDPELAHGLNTGRQFKEDLSDDLPITDGMLLLNMRDFTLKQHQLNAKYLKPL